MPSPAQWLAWGQVIDSPALMPPLSLPRGGTTLTARRSYTLTGCSAALALRHALDRHYSAGAARCGHTVAAGSYTLNGSPADFCHSVPATGDAGAYTLTGSDAGLTVISGVVLFCGSGSYTLNGSDATFVLPAPPTTDNYAGGGVRRIRKYERKRKRDELEELLQQLVDYAESLPPAPVVDEPHSTIPPQPNLLASLPKVKAALAKRVDPDEEEDEIALLLELIS